MRGVKTAHQVEPGLRRCKSSPNRLARRSHPSVFNALVLCWQVGLSGRGRPVGGCSSVAERLLCKQNVGSSTLLSSTKEWESAGFSGSTRAGSGPAGRACSSVG